MKTKIKLAVAEDSDYNLNLLKLTLSRFSNVVVTVFASNGEELLHQINSSTIPDVVLMDIKMPVKGGILTTMELVKKYPEIKILAYTLHDNEEMVEHMLKAGAKGYMFKSTPATELLEIIEQTCNNTFNQHRDIYAGILTEYRNSQTQEEAHKITKNELTILLYICSGFINKEIAAKMELSEGTVNTYRHSLLRKTNCRNTADLLCFAIKAGYFQPTQNRGGGVAIIKNINKNIRNNHKK